MTPDQRFKEIVKLFRACVGRRGLYDVFTDFCETYALAMRNATSKMIPGDAGFDEREEDFQRIASRYTEQDMTRFKEAFAHVVQIMEDEPCDVLGRVFMELEISDKTMGQFYTPYDVAVLIAEMNVSGLVQALEAQDHVTVHEPACGAGAMLVAITQALRRRGINYQHRMHVRCEDLALTATYMAYIHLTLLGVPAMVARRDTLTRETFFEWPTLAHVLGGWRWRLLAREDAAEPEPIYDTDVSSWDDVFSEVA